MSKKLGLALGGGGGRGAAHIGVLFELERLNIRPHLISGTSIGGLVGALYACGKSVEEIKAFFQKLNVTSMYALGKGPALSHNSKLEKLLEEEMGRPSFSDLHTPLAVVATDLVQRETVILDDGDVITAVLATTALPLVLPPVEREERYLVDGGLLNNVPFDVVKARGASAVLGIDLTNTAPYGTEDDDEPPAFGVVDRVLNLSHRYKTWQLLSTVVDIVTLQSLNTRLALSAPDLLLRPYLGTIGLLDFHRWEEGIEIGLKSAQEHHSDLIFLSAHGKVD